MGHFVESPQAPNGTSLQHMTHPIVSRRSALQLKQAQRPENAADQRRGQYIFTRFKEIDDVGGAEVDSTGIRKGASLPSNAVPLY